MVFKSRNYILLSLKIVEKFLFLNRLSTVTSRWHCKPGNAMVCSPSSQQMALNPVEYSSWVFKSTSTSTPGSAWILEYLTALLVKLGLTAMVQVRISVIPECFSNVIPTITDVQTTSEWREPFIHKRVKSPSHCRGNVPEPVTYETFTNF